jgi:hypothetical protein
MLITAGCTKDSMDTSKQLSLSSAPTQQEPDTDTYTDKATDALGSYYYNTVSFLTDGCGVGAYSMATGKAVTGGIVGGLWGASHGSLLGAGAGNSVEGMVIGSIVGSSVGLVIGLKSAYDGFQVNTAGCSSKTETST